MLRLSRPGWNNVLIVTMLIMIYMFNSDLFNRQVEQETDVPMAIFGDDAVLVEVNFGQFKIERIGNHWRQMGDQDIASPSELSEMWRHVIGQPVSEAVSLKSAPYVVVLSFAGQEQKTVMEVFVEASKVYLRFNGKLSEVVNQSPENLLPNFSVGES